MGFDLCDISGIVITHEHSDHVCALKRLCDHVPLYAHPLTAKAIYDRQGVLKNYRAVDFYENGFDIGDIKVLPFRIPHDAEYPLGYTFKCGGHSVSIATDMGFATNGVFQNIKDSQVVLLESNHDVEMLMNGPYTPALKKRILSKNGHLSNDMAAVMAERLVGGKTHTIVLGHLSEQNNLPELALGTVKGRVDKLGGGVRITVALQNEISEVFETDEK
jgi:phosphoribosyl 1,2-cyclic phosphodiesterase